MSEPVTKKMTLGEVISKYPEVAGIMLEYGLHCIGCHVAAWETVEQGALAHGMKEKEIEEMLKEINEKIGKKKRSEKK